MQDKLKQIPNKLIEIWKKYTSKQKAIIGIIAASVILAFVLLYVVSQQVEYQVLTVAENKKETNEIVALLKAEGIAYEVDQDAVTVSVDENRYLDAVLLLADNDVPSTGISIDELLDNSLSTTNNDRTLKINLFMQNQLRAYISQMDGVEDAEVYYIPENSTNTILADSKETSASVLLKVNDDFKSKTAETIAELVASVIGNKTAEQIKVVDQKGNLLYSGAKDLYSGSANSDEDFKEKLRNTFINNLYMGLIKTGYDDVEIMPNLVFNMNRVTELYKEYLPADGQEQGLFEKSYTYSSENAGTSGGVPGTTSNDNDTDYLTQDSSASNGSVEIEENNYLPNERVTNTEYEVGAISSEQSTISIVLRKIVTYKEEDMVLQGLLEDITFEEYALQNNGEVKAEVDEDVVKMVSKATGILEDNIQVIAYEQPVFVPHIEIDRNWTDYLAIILAVLIVALLGFVVFKVLRPVEVTELEPELSVEQLLATTKESQSIEDIEFNESSEVRRMIEKFVDEKPEAVAQLLRNWLNEDWGN